MKRPFVSFLTLGSFIVALFVVGAPTWIASSALVASPDGVWFSALHRSDQLQETRFQDLTDYSLLTLNSQALQAVLEKAPLEGQVTAAVLSLPMPNGSWSRFALVNTPVMEPALAAKYPQIQTYRGQGVDDLAASVRLDWTPAGFHAVVFAPDQVVVINPLSPEDQSVYVSYALDSFAATKQVEDVSAALSFFLGTDSADVSAALAVPEPRRIGENLRVYRLAVAATGEFTAKNGGTVASSLATIVTTINSVNGLYERDLAVRLVLVANNDQVIYTNGATDPYNGTIPPELVDENQLNLDAVIGTANYDVGHLFTGDVWGYALFYGPCSVSNKARGTTGHIGPAGNMRDIALTAHELGHQFGALHSFNGTGGICGGNRSASGAYEPGSGSTVMSYAGRCGPEENLQPERDFYFHSASILQIEQFLATGGDACAQKVATGNTPPSAAADADHTIPANTPFYLTGSGSDANDPDEALTYTWEQIDLGNPSPPMSDDGSRPLIRSLEPSSSPTRIIPRMSDLLNRTSTIGEALPTTSRTLNFNLIVRDNNPNGGGVSIDSMQVAVDGTKGPFKMTSPDTPVVWNPGEQQIVTWDVAGTDQAPVSCAQVQILLSIDGGQTFTSLGALTPNDGITTVLVPNTPSTQARTMVECGNNIFFDIADYDFTITDTPAPTPLPDLPFDTFVPAVAK